MAPDEALLQLLSILPDSEYEVEKRMCSTGQRLDRDQVLLMIPTRYDNLLSQRNKWVDEGMPVTLLLLMLEVPGTAVPCEALEVMGVGAKVDVGGDARVENGGENDGEKKMAKQPPTMLTTETSTALKEATQGVTVVARSGTKQCDAPDRCVAFAVERAIRLSYAPTSSPSLPVKLTRVAATVTGVLGEDSRTPLSTMHQARFSMVKGVIVR